MGLLRTVWQFGSPGSLLLVLGSLALGASDDKTEHPNCRFVRLSQSKSPIVRLGRKDSAAPASTSQEVPSCVTDFGSDFGSFSVAF
jgi:hypothetical protein